MNLLNFVDRFIPEQEKLQSGVQFNELFRYRFTIISCLLSVIVGSALMLVKFLTESNIHFSMYLTILFICGYACMPYLIRRQRNFRLGMYYHAFFYVFFVPFRVAQTGGYENVYVLLLPLLPLITTFMVSARFTFFVTSGVLFNSMLITMFNGEYKFFPVTPVADLTAMFFAIFLLFAGVFFMAIIGRQKFLSLSYLEKQNRELNTLQSQKVSNERKEAYFEMVRAYHSRFRQPTGDFRELLGDILSGKKELSEENLDRLDQYLDQLNSLSISIRNSVDSMAFRDDKGTLREDEVA